MYSQMRANIVWDLIDLLKARKAIGNKWILKYKQKVDGSIDEPNAQMVP